MIEESIVVSEGGVFMPLDRFKPVYRMRHGTKTKYLKEYNILGLIKFYRLIREETVWDDYFVDYDMKTGELVNKQKINSIH